MRVPLAVVAVVAVLVAGAGGAAAQGTGQSPDCTRFCMSVTPAQGTVGDTVFRIAGRGWRPRGRVSVFYGPYCDPGEACPAIAYFVRIRANRRGGFVFRFRDGDPQSGDAEHHIHAGSHGPVFEQLVGKVPHKRLVRRRPEYTATPPSS